MNHPSKYYNPIEHVQHLANNAEYIRCYGLLHIDPQNTCKATLTTNDNQTINIQHRERINPAYNNKHAHILGMRYTQNPITIHSELIYVAIPHATNNNVIIFAHRHNNRRWKYSKRYDVLTHAVTRNQKIIGLSLAPHNDPTALPWAYRFQTSDQRHHKWFYTRRRKCVESANVQRMQPLYAIPTT